LQASAFVELTLKKYQQLAGYPFLDWQTNPAHRSALKELWDGIFKTAAGQRAQHYRVVPELERDPEQAILHLQTPDWLRRVRLSACPDGGGFAIFDKMGDDEYTPENAFHPLLRPTGYLPDRTELNIVTDLDANRLIASFEMIRQYTQADIPNYVAGLALDKQFIASYRHLFGYAEIDPFSGATG
jgi:hypothetical protein